MITKHIDKIIAGDKRAVLRRKQKGDVAELDQYTQSVMVRIANEKDTSLFKLGEEQAVQRTGNTEAQARVEITKLDEQDVRAVSYSQITRLGYTDVVPFIVDWSRQNDEAGYQMLVDRARSINSDPTLKSEIHRARYILASRPAELYECWWAEFDVITDSLPDNKEPSNPFDHEGYFKAVQTASQDILIASPQDYKPQKVFNFEGYLLPGQVLITSDRVRGGDSIASPLDFKFNNIVRAIQKGSPPPPNTVELVVWDGVGQLGFLYTPKFEPYGNDF